MSLWDIAAGFVLMQEAGGMVTGLDKKDATKGSFVAANTSLTPKIVELVEAALYGDRAAANRYATLLDARPAGGLLLAIAVTYCGCGAPFDLEATPNFKARLAESGLSWPPPVAIRYPPLKQAAP